jgi:hypothetical protein
VARRAAQFAAQAVLGIVDDIVASPRLLPVLLLELLCLFGYDQARRAWRALSAQAIASGTWHWNLGTGGPTRCALPPACCPKAGPRPLEKRSWTSSLLYACRTGSLMTELQMIGGRLAGIGRERGRA